MHCKWEGFLLRILRILNMSCLLMLGFQLFLKFNIIQEIQISVIYFPYLFRSRTRTHNFLIAQYPYWPRTIFLKKFNTRIRTRTGFSKLIRTRPYPVPKISDFINTPYFSVPVPGYFGEGVRIPSPYSGVWFKHKNSEWLTLFFRTTWMRTNT